MSSSLFSITLVLFAVITNCTSTLAQSRSTTLQGEVKDQHGSVIASAKVTLTDVNNSTQTTVSNERGSFKFSNLIAGDYTLKVEAENFAAYQETLTFTNADPISHLAITLYPTIQETVTVEDNQSSVTLDPARAAGALVLTEQTLKNLPDDPDQLTDLLQLLATSSGSGIGEADVTVDGFSNEGRLPPKSAIREIRINNNIFSAEYDKPPYRGGRIDIYTKPGAGSLHGTAFFNFNNSALNARDAFAPQRLPVKTRRYGLQFGGPVVRKRMGFLFDYETRNIQETTTINAIVLDNNLQSRDFTTNIETPKLLRLGSLRTDWQINQDHTFIFRYDFNQEQANNLGVGGFDLQNRANNSRSVTHTLRFSETAVVGKASLNELRVGLTFNRINQRAQSNDVAIIVAGAFSDGGARLQSLRQQEWRLELTDNYSLVAGSHTVKLGAQVLGRNVTDQRAENFNGTFYFGGLSAPQLDTNGMALVGRNGAPMLINISGLEQYRRTLLQLPGGKPTQFLLNRGNPLVSDQQWTLAGFIQDEWHWRYNSLLSLGLRYEAQTNPTTMASFGPRIGIGYSPDKKRQWVLRARVGLFFDRITLPLALETLRLDGIRMQQFIIDTPSFPDPFQSGIVADVIPTIRRKNPNLRPPTSLQTQLGFERQLPHGWKLDVSYYISRGWGLLHSRNINAPLVGSTDDPETAPRPLGVQQNILQFESNGSLNGRVLFIGINQATRRLFNIFSGYLWFDFHTDADYPFLLPQSSYDRRGELARPIWQARHRFFLVGLLNLPMKLRVSAELNIASGNPFNITTGRDNNGDGNFNDRPSLTNNGNSEAVATPFGMLDPTAINGTLPRNLGTNPFNATLDFNLSRTFNFGNKKQTNEQRYQLMLNVQANNLLNRTNLFDVDGVLTAPFFARANRARPARRLEIGMRLTF
ncbi:MAG: TonB-dependent receptor [Acidobacteriota bacterium]